MTINRVEQGLMLCVTALVAVTASQWPSAMPAGRFVLWLSVIFLLHTLVRDLYLYNRSKKSTLAPREAQCFCLESSVGVVFLVLAFALIGTNAGGVLSLTTVTWITSVTIVLWLNYWMKDLVFSWNPWRIYRDPNHLNIIPRFRIK